LFDAAESTSRLPHTAGQAPEALPAGPAAWSAIEPRASTRPRSSPGVTVDDTMVAAGRKVMLCHLERLASSLAAARAGDRQGIAAASEAVRHLRSARRIFDLEMIGPREGRIRVQLRRLDRRLETIVGLDALLRDLDDALTGLPSDQAWGLDILRASWRGEREAGRRRLARDIAPRRCRRWVGALWNRLQDETLGADPAGVSMKVAHRVTSLVWDAYERAWDSALLEGAGDTASLRGLCRTVEGLRHTLEAFGEILPDAGTLVAAVGEFEDHVAVLRDAGLAAAMAREFARARVTKLTVSEQAAIDSFVVSREAIVARQRSSPPDSWGSVMDPVFREALEAALEGARR
jgi:CHAD domain